MAEQVLYNNSGQPVAKETAFTFPDGSASYGFTFTTGTAAGTLSDVMVGLVDGTSTDGGSVAVRLFSTTSEMGVPYLGSQIADVGLASDAALSYSTIPTDLAVASPISLAPNTTYAILLTSVLGSNASLTQAAGDAGTGVAGGRFLSTYTITAKNVVPPPPSSTDNSTAGAAIGRVEEGSSAYQTIDPNSNLISVSGAGINNSGEVLGYADGAYFTDQGGFYSKLPADFEAASINSAGQVAGTSFSSSMNIGLVFNKDGTTTTLTGPAGAISLHVSGITDGGLVYGTYSGSQEIDKGFIENSGVYTDVYVPGSANTFLVSANDLGSSVGYAYDSFGNIAGFEDSNGLYKIISDPSGANTQASAINSAGQIIGSYQDVSGKTQSFIDDNGTFKTISYPGEPSGSVTTLTGINANGQVVGTTSVPGEAIATVSFVYDDRNGSYTPLSGPPGSASYETYGSGVNDLGQVVGTSGATAFVYTPPASAPPTTVLYDDTTQPVTQEGRLSLKNGSTGGFTFTTGSAAGTLADVKLSLVDSNPSDGGSVAVRLFTTTDQSVLDGTKIADLGLIADSSLSAFSPTPTDIPISASIALAPNTTYLIEATGVLGSNAILAQEAADAGTGVAGGQEVILGASGSGGSSSNSTVGAVVAEVSEAVVCFASGTRIKTNRGDIAVESLMVGDMVVCVSGTHRPIRWLGHRTIDCRRHLRPSEVMPIRIAAHAFGRGRPARDLYVSPGHAICIDIMGGVLIPAGVLANGTTIAPSMVERVIYWHVEVDEHEIILAEELPCESYLEMGNRNFFAELGTVALTASPDAPARTHADFCRPFYASGPLVDAVRARLSAGTHAFQSKLKYVG